MFETSDIYLAAYLRAHGEALVAIRMTGGKGTFQFSKPNDELLSAFDLGAGQVEPLAYTNALRHLTSSCKRATAKAQP